MTQVQVGNLFNKVSSAFQEKGLSLPKRTRNKIWGQDKRKQPFILSLFSNSSEARTFENQVSQARKKEALNIKTQRMDSKTDAAFPISTLQTTFEYIKTCAIARVDELKR